MFVTQTCNYARLFFFHVERSYGIYLAHTSFLKGVYDSETLEEIGLYAVRQTFVATKRKHIRNLAGYYNGMLDRMLDRLYETRFDELTHSQPVNRRTGRRFGSVRFTFDDH